MKRPVVIAILAVVFMAAQGVMRPGPAIGQNDVIKTTTDASGFEHPHTEVDLMYQTAKQLMAAGQYAKAAAELEKVMAADGSRLDALHDLGQCYGHLEEYAKAAAAYQKAVDANPGDVRLLTNLGYYQMRAQDMNGAMTTYQMILKVDPLNYEGNRWLGYIYERQATKKKDKELYQKALKHYEDALKVKPDDVKVIGSMAKIYGDLGNQEKSLEMYEDAIAASSGEEALALKAQLGKMYIEQSQWEKSVEVFTDLVQAYPDRSAFLYNLGVSQIQLKRYDDALPHLEAAIKYEPGFCLAYQPLATCLENAKKYSDAMNIVRKGLEVCDADKQAGLYYEWGRSLEGLGRYGEAIEKFQVAANDPTWGPSAKKQIKRQEDLIRRAKAIQNQ